MKTLTQKILTMVAVALLASSSTAKAQTIDVAEHAEMDAAASLLGSISKWVANDPEAAIAAFEQHDRVRQAALSHSGRRAVQINASIKTWDEFMPKYHKQQPKQIATELKRQRDAVERYKKSKNPRPGSFAYIPKTVWKTKDRLDVLTASGFDTNELQAEQEKVQTMVLELLKTLDSEVIAKKNGFVRDAYKKDDRSSIEAIVRGHWAEENGETPIERIVMPKASWPHTYSARFDDVLGKVVPKEMDRVTVYVATRKSESVLTLHPVRLERENWIVNGKRLGTTVPQKASVIPTNEFAFDVLEKNLR